MNRLRSASASAVFAAPPDRLPLPRQLQVGRAALFTFAFGSSPWMLAWHPPAGLKRVAVRGDGRCLFRAIAKNLASTDGRKLPEHLELADADALRNIAWEAICHRRRNEFIARNIIEGNITRYCAISRSPAYFAGEPELFALADELKRPIKIFLRTAEGKMRNIVTYGGKHKLKKKPHRGDGVIRLLYVDGNHYDALLPN